MTDDDTHDRLLAAALAEGMPPPPPGYGRGASAPEWYRPDSTTGRLYELSRLRSLMWWLALAKLREYERFFAEGY